LGSVLPASQQSLNCHATGLRRMLPVVRRGLCERVFLLTLIVALEVPGLSLRGFLFHRATFASGSLLVTVRGGVCHRGLGNVIEASPVTLLKHKNVTGLISATGSKTKRSNLVHPPPAFLGSPFNVAIAATPAKERHATFHCPRQAKRRPPVLAVQAASLSKANAVRRQPVRHKPPLPLKVPTESGSR